MSEFFCMEIGQSKEQFDDDIVNFAVAAALKID